MNKNDQFYKLKSRELGDEWEAWTGILEENNGDLETSHAVFLILTTLSTFIILVITWSLYLLGIPYYKSTFLMADLIAFWVAGTITLVSIISYILLVLTLIFKKPFAFFLKDKHFAELFITKISLFLGSKIGISQDKMINSMLKIGNSLTMTLYNKIEKDELLLVVPRCLSLATREKLNQIVKREDLKLHIASGGTQARKILMEIKPKGIIAVACERDLYAGVRDVPSQIPVIAIANKRPEGPCKNTLINSEQIEEAIRFFLKKK